MSLLPYHVEIIQKLAPGPADEDGQDGSVLVLARGLGLLSILASIAALCCTETSLVFLLNAAPHEETLLAERLSLVRASAAQSRLSIIKTEVSSNERAEIYKRGGVVSVTSRMLVVDLLAKRIPCWMVSGFLVMHAEELTELSMEAFILTIYRSENKIGFIRALTDMPESLCYGFNRLEKFLKSLKLTDIHLYPRFHVSIASQLETVDVQVTETSISLTPKMNTIQISILGIMETCIAEIVKCNPGLECDSLTIDHSLFRSFDVNLKAQLDAIWHLVGAKTKQLLMDLKLLRSLLNDLVMYDCVTFYRYVEALILAQGSLLEPSLWLATDSADVIFQLSRERVFNKGEEPIFEENPKWKCLLDTIQDIIKSRRGRTILVMVGNEHGVAQLSEILTGGTRVFFERAHKNYKAWKKAVSKGELHVASNPKHNKWTLKRKGQEQVKKEIKEALEESESNSSHPKRKLDETNSKSEDASSVDEGFAAGQKLSSDMADVSFLKDGSFTVLNGPQVVIQSYACMDGLELLKRHSPSDVVLYDADLTFIRTIEVYQALCQHSELRVHFFMYKESIEEQKYLFSIRKEKEAFEKLIKEKSNISIKREGDPAWRAPSDVGYVVKDTPAKPKVLVDMREFRSSFPFSLYKKNFQVVPATFEVGDYILSPRICVERKTISDLIGSFANGRLFHQVSSMSAHYALPFLLLEFDPSKSFVLQASSSSDVSFNDLSSKICLLLLHFPKLKLLWSSSPSATCDLFTDLQRNEDAPDCAQAAKAGLESNGGGLAVDFNLIPKALLTAIPGLPVSFHPTIYSHFDSMRQLISASLERLTLVLGKDMGTRLFDFFNKPIQARPGRDINPAWA